VHAVHVNGWQAPPPLPLPSRSAEMRRPPLGVKVPPNIRLSASTPGTAGLVVRCPRFSSSGMLCLLCCLSERILIHAQTREAARNRFWVGLREIVVGWLSRAFEGVQRCTHCGSAAAQSADEGTLRVTAGSRDAPARALLQQLCPVHFAEDH
jgi:hypothetical protein